MRACLYETLLLGVQYEDRFQRHFGRFPLFIVDSYGRRRFCCPLGSLSPPPSHRALSSGSSRWAGHAQITKSRPRSDARLQTKPSKTSSSAMRPKKQQSIPDPPTSRCNGLFIATMSYHQSTLSHACCVGKLRNEQKCYFGQGKRRRNGERTVIWPKTLGVGE